MIKYVRRNVVFGTNLRLRQQMQMMDDHQPIKKLIE
jgi:hypothetical protein